MSHKTIYIGIAVVLALAVAFIVYSELPPRVDKAWAAELQARSAELNKNLPVQIDEGTILNTTGAKGNTLEFQHTWATLQKEDVDVDKTGPELYAALRVTVCSSEDLRVYREHGTTLHYVYYDKDGDYVLGLKLETRDCK